MRVRVCVCVNYQIRWKKASAKMGGEKKRSNGHVTLGFGNFTFVPVKGPCTRGPSNSIAFCLFQ